MADIDYTLILLDEQMRAHGLDIAGSTLGEISDKSTWRVTWPAGVKPTADEISRAQAVIDSYDVVAMKREGARRIKKARAANGMPDALEDVISDLIAVGTVDKKRLKASTVKILRDRQIIK